MAEFVLPWLKTIGHISVLFFITWLIMGQRPTYQQTIGLVAIAALARTYMSTPPAKEAAHD